MPPTPQADPAVRNVLPGERPVRPFDGGGRYVEVSPTGSKPWRWTCRFAGDEKRLALRACPGTQRKDACVRRDAARALLPRAMDPGEHRKAVKAARSAREWQDGRPGRNELSAPRGRSRSAWPLSRCRCCSARRTAEVAIEHGGVGRELLRGRGNCTFTPFCCCDHCQPEGGCSARRHPDGAMAELQTHARSPQSKDDPGENRFA